MTKKRLLRLIFSGMIIQMFGCGGSIGEGPPAGTQQYIPVPLADPFILLDEGTYYAYGTYAADGILALVSDDLKTWTVPETPYPEGLVLHKNDVWGNAFFWAPEVYKMGDTFYMYYSGDEHICVATSKSPLGPFVQEEKRP